MAALQRWAKGVFRRAPLAPIQFPTTGFEVIPANVLLEEEQYDDFGTGNYCPVRIGDLYDDDTYQILGKLGFGSTSTVWLARNLQDWKYVAIKVFMKNHGELCKAELERYERISSANRWHPGHSHVRTADRMFSIPRPGGAHHCLVQPPMWDSWKDLLERNESGRFSTGLLKGGLRHLLLALDYLHTECKLVHTGTAWRLGRPVDSRLTCLLLDIKADNILHAIADDGILESFVKSEIDSPSPRKDSNGAPVYLSRRFGLPEEFGRTILSDFGEVVDGETERTHNAQPNVYRSPEVMLQAPWSYPIDIWNVGAMIWDVFEGGHLFHGHYTSPGKGYYTTKAHLSEIIGMLGPPPIELLQRGKRSREFFSESDISLEKAELVLSGRNKEMFLKFVRGMLAWRPEDRKTAKELLEDPWLTTWEISD
ncbi:hypothetical protein MY10362_008522 [Beauveria mimosiformis]